MPRYVVVFGDYSIFTGFGTGFWYGSRGVFIV
jgi:hypothetical protein